MPYYRSFQEYVWVQKLIGSMLSCWNTSVKVMAEGASWKVKWVESRLFYLNKQQSTEPLTMYVPSYNIESDWCHPKCFECTQPLDLGYGGMCGRHHCCVICDWETVDLDVGFDCLQSQFLRNLCCWWGLLSADWFCYWSGPGSIQCFEISAVYFWRYFNKNQYCRHEASLGIQKLSTKIWFLLVAVPSQTELLQYVQNCMSKSLAQLYTASNMWCPWTSHSSYSFKLWPSCTQPLICGVHELANVHIASSSVAVEQCPIVSSWLGPPFEQSNSSSGYLESLKINKTLRSKSLHVLWKTQCCSHPFSWVEDVKASCIPAASWGMWMVC